MIRATGPDARRRTLADFGASGAALDELVAYTENVFQALRFETVPTFPLPDEPHIAVWREYAYEADEIGAIDALRRHLVQLRFPVESGISQSEEYRGATRRGEFPSDDRRPRLVNAGDIELKIHSTIAGHIPLLIVPERRDFVTLVQVFSARNEPEPVPDSMGACIVTGLNNWDRVARYRQSWMARNPESDEDSWADEFSRIVPRKDLYQDRFIILSRSPYSAVPAGSAGFDDREWLDLSLAIRRDHECTHYFTLRTLNSMRNNLLDELIADYVGLVRTFGHYRADLALQFFGLERFPRYREGARLQNYRGNPPLSDAAFNVLKNIVYEAVRNLQAFDEKCSRDMREPAGLGSLVIALATMSLDELADVPIARQVDAFFTATLPGSLASIERPADNEIRLHMKNQHEELDRVVDDFSNFAKAHRLPTSTIAHVNMALDEILSNIIKYGYDDDGEHQIRVSIRVEREGLELEIVDDAKPFNILEAPDPDTSLSVHDRQIGGLGVYLVKRLMDASSYSRDPDGLNRLYLRKNFAA